MKLFSLLKSFATRKEGSVAMGLGLTFTMVAGATIGAIEIEQMQKARNVMQDKLDATILYLGNSPYKTTPQDAGAAYFYSMLETTDLDLKTVDPKFNFENETGNIVGTVDFEITGLMTGGLLQSRDLEVRAVATPKTKGTVEISMVLDVSGSMGWSFTSNSAPEPDEDGNLPKSRMDGLKDAADALFNTIYENPQAVPHVAVIPYAASVDITDLYAGQSLSRRSDHYKGLNNESTNDIKMLHGLKVNHVGMGLLSPSGSHKKANVVTTRDRTHTMGIWSGERLSGLDDFGNYKINLNMPSSSDKMRIFIEDEADLYCAGYQINEYGQECTKWTYDNGWKQGGYQKPTMGVMPMTTNTDAVREYVGNFSAAGGTAGHIGTLWGLYALAPEWNDVFAMDQPAVNLVDEDGVISVQESEPAHPAKAWDETTEKYLIIMTDGQFNSQKDPNMSNSEMYDYFQAICTTARDKGVRIFTVGLLLDDNTETQLAQCSGTSGGFYSVDTRLELVEAFRSVGRETGELRLSH